MKATKQSMQHALTMFFMSSLQTSIPSKSAFTQSRKQLQHQVFIQMNDILVSGIYEEHELQFWSEFRLLAIDGSTLKLPDSTEIRDHFGMQDNQFSRYPMARISCCYDVLNHITVAAELGHYHCGEYDQACALISRIPDSHDLILFDRGYGALWFFHFLLRHHKNFVIRLNSTMFPGIIDQPEGSTLREFSQPNYDTRKSFKRRHEPFSPFTIRLVVLTLDDGQREILATSLLDQGAYPDKIFKDLYALRWGIEESFKQLKVHAEIENFSGKTLESVQQDFFADIVVENLRVMFELDANKELLDSQKIRNLRYRYQVNRNLSLGIMKEKLVDLLTSTVNIDELYEQTKVLFKIMPIPIKNGRHNERSFDRVRAKRHFFMSNRRVT